MNRSKLADRLGPLVFFGSNWISVLGILLTTTAGVSWFFTLPALLGQGESNPYLGLLATFALPAAFISGLLLIPLGIWLKERGRIRRGTYPVSFPPLNWANEKFRQLVGLIALATVANVVVGGHLTYSAVERMTTVSFCGQSCHVMEPEFVAFQVSSHAHLRCVDCHVGEGFDSYVESKINGTKQLIEVMLGTYPTPIPTPVHSFAQGKSTCQGCHADLDLGSKRREWITFAEGETNSATRTELLLHIGGATNPNGAHGVHREGTLEYRSDASRQQIPWMRYRAPDGRVTEYAVKDWDESRADELELREMDCIDCHNRAAHSFEAPGKSLDASLAANRIDPSLPAIKREGLRLLRAEYASQQDAAQGIPEALRAFYEGEHPDVAGGRQAAIETAGRELVEIYSRNVFPAMKVTWGTHPNFIGHEDTPGCFRCHDNDHLSLDDESRPVGDRCESCHEMRIVDQPISPPSAPLLTETPPSRDVIPREFRYNTQAGPVRFDHTEHERLSNGECPTCHNRLFPMNREPLAYAADLHRFAEANQTSCAGCHRPGGEAFGTEDCARCHSNLSQPRVASASTPAAGQSSLLPGLVTYQSKLGEAVFDHAKHVDHAKGDCTSCHNRLFPMNDAPLRYGEDLHRSAEAAKTSCAGCHVAGGEAFAAAGNCMKCHAGLGEPTATPVTGNRGISESLTFDTRLGDARFGHDEHIKLAEGDCTVCHTKIFPLEKGLLNYADDLHRTAESTKTSCGACHLPQGDAFGSAGNCARCHVDLTARAPGSAMGLPARVIYENELGKVSFDHDAHIKDAEGKCEVCHDRLFAMEKVPLQYAEDYHRTAESEKSSCAACHVEGGDSFPSLENCDRCHEGLELDPQPKQAALPAIPLGFLLFQLPRILDPEPKYVGSEKCAACHREEVVEFRRANPHDVLEKTARWETTEIACEACHGPGLQHVLHLDPAELTDFRRGQSEGVNQSCLQCHASDAALVDASRDRHSRSGVVCTQCHQVHANAQPRLLASDANALCSSCHIDVRAQFNRPYAHRIAEGVIECVDCHNPHGEPPQGLMSRSLANEASCLACHADKRGPFPFEHAPVKMEPCSSCHEPHGSANPRLLTRHDAGRLCIECHSMTDGSLGGAPPGFHDLRTARFQSCTSCHTKIHGSFVSRDFLR